MSCTHLLKHFNGFPQPHDPMFNSQPTYRNCHFSSSATDMPTQDCHMPSHIPACAVALYIPQDCVPLYFMLRLYNCFVLFFITHSNYTSHMKSFFILWVLQNALPSCNIYLSRLMTL